MIFKQYEINLKLQLIVKVKVGHLVQDIDYFNNIYYLLVT
jgi:hypothetical protein